VRTIEVAVHPLGGDNFKIRLDATTPSVGEAKAEIARVRGTEEARQELLAWRTFAEGCVALSEEGAVVMHITEDEDLDSLTTTGVELTEGKHYWEVELLSDSGGGIVDTVLLFILLSHMYWC
jgi:hypothetical protein